MYGRTYKTYRNKAKMQALQDATLLWIIVEKKDQKEYTTSVVKNVSCNLCKPRFLRTTSTFHTIPPFCQCSYAKFHYTTIAYKTSLLPLKFHAKSAYTSSSQFVMNYSKVVYLCIIIWTPVPQTDNYWYSLLPP